MCSLPLVQHHQGSVLEILLVDGNSLGYTSYHAGDTCIISSGLQTQAIDGFIRALSYKLWLNPRLLPIVIWDGTAHWRFQLHPDYKSGRNRTQKQQEDRAAYQAQVPHLQRLLKHLGVLQLRAPEAEADDLAFQLCQHLPGDQFNIELLSTDSDWWQFLAPNIVWQGCRKASPRVQFSTFAQQTGYVSPAAFIEGKALKGDSADDIDGIVNIGDKTATQILAKYGSKAGFYDALDKKTVSTNRKTFQAMASPEGRALWERNIQLMDLSRAPRLAGGALQVASGGLSRDGLLRIAEPLALTNITARADDLLDRFDAQVDTKNAVLALLTTML